MKEKVLVTGGAGFIGSHLCDLLIKNGHHVVAIDDLSTGSLENIKDLISRSNFQFVRETIANKQVLDRLCSEANIVIHLAAAVGVKLIVENPVHTINANIFGTESVLSTANRYGCKVLIASSSEVYGKGTQIPFKETDDRLMGPTTHSRWAYANSKAVDEFLGLAYYKQYRLPVIIMRFFNTIGPRQTGRYGMVVPRFVRQALQGKDLQVYGDGKQTRCFVDVSDVIHAIMSLALQPEAIGEVFNIGNTEEISIRQLADRIIKLTDSTSEVQYVPYEKAYAPGFEDMRRRVPSIEKIRNLINFMPQFNLEDSLIRIIEYEKTNIDSWIDRL